MSKVVKTSDVPADPKRLYIYLYCDKLGCYKSATKKKAAKSWLSLSESKRRRFLKTCRLRKNLNNTQRVLSTEPFLKPLFNSPAEDTSNSNITGDETNKLCVDEINQVQKETCLREQLQFESCLDDDEIHQNETCVGDDEVHQNKTCLNFNDGHQNKTCLNDNDVHQNETGLNDVQQNKTYLDEQQQNKTILDDDNERQFSTDTENEKQEDIHSFVNESYISNNNNKNVQMDIMKHVNSICKDINRSDTESLASLEVRTIQRTKENDQETNTNNSRNGLFINNIREPIPPSVKNWKELFEALNKDKNIKAEDLSASDKRTYVVLLIKIRREYIEQYIKYLESLTDKQLYEHYLKEF